MEDKRKEIIINAVLEKLGRSPVSIYTADDILTVANIRCIPELRNMV